MQNLRVSYDLAALSAVLPLGPDEAAAIYARLAEGQAWDTLLQPDHRLDAFVRDITRRWPQLRDVPEDEVENSPWSVDFEMSPAHVMCAIQWPQADDVGPVFVETALQHGLNVFDPQEGILHTPGHSPRSVVTRNTGARICASCGKPIDEGNLTAELPGIPGIHHLQCMLKEWPPGSRN